MQELDYPAPEDTTGFIEVPSVAWAKTYGVTEASDFESTPEEDAEWRAIMRTLPQSPDIEDEEDLADDFDG